MKNGNASRGYLLVSWPARARFLRSSYDRKIKRVGSGDGRTGRD